MYLYNGETVRVYTDEMIGSVQTRDEGTVDIDVIRDRMGPDHIGCFFTGRQ